MKVKNVCFHISQKLMDQIALYLRECFCHRGLDTIIYEDLIFSYRQILRHESKKCVFPHFSKTNRPNCFIFDRMFLTQGTRY